MATVETRVFSSLASSSFSCSPVVIPEGTDEVLMPTPTSSLTDDKSPSPCNELLHPKSQWRGMGLFPATPWQQPVFAGGSPTFWDAISTFQLITAAGIMLQSQPECLCSLTRNQVADAEAAELAACFSSPGSPAFAVCQASTLSLLRFLSLVCLSNILTYHRAHWNDVSWFMYCSLGYGPQELHPHKLKLVLQNEKHLQKCCLKQSTEFSFQ